MSTVFIGKRPVGPGHPCFLIAEAGVNHNGDRCLAHKLIDAAADSGADAIKFQTFSANKLAIAAAPKAEYQLALNSDESQYAMLARLELKAEWHENLQTHCYERGIIFLSSPFDIDSIDFLQEIGVPAFKIPSGEITNYAYLHHMAKKGRPIILSTGMSYLQEVLDAVNIIRRNGNERIILLHCLSDYPAKPAEVNLRAMKTLAETCKCPVGFSDHTECHVSSIAAVALGACVIERHFTLDCRMDGPDHKASLEPKALADLFSEIRLTQAALGNGVKIPQPSENSNRKIVRKSIVARQEILAGSILDWNDLSYLRPGDGLSPTVAHEIVGRQVLINIAAGTKLDLDMFYPKS